MKAIYFCIKIIIKIYSKIYNYIIRDICTLIATIYLKSSGVELAKNVIFFGLPFVSVYIGSKISIGDNVVLRSNYKGNAIGINHKIILRTQSSAAIIDIGNNSGISGGAICAHKRIVIGTDTLIGANVVIADNDFHSIDPKDRLNKKLSIISKEIKIGNNVWIGADSYILKGVSIGDNSVIGAKSVVTNDIPANCIAAGSPAKTIRFFK